MPDLRVVRYEPALRESVLDLLAHHWGRDRSLNAAQFAWKYSDSPYAEQSRVYVALVDSRAIAMRGFFGSRWQAGLPAQTFDLLSAALLVIHPAHRGRGVFTALMSKAVADIDGSCPYIVSLGAGSATRLGSLTMKWKQVGRIVQLASSARAARAAPWQRAAATALARLWPEAASPFARIDRHIRHGSARLDGGVLLADSPRPAAMADVVRRLTHDGRIRHIRDEAYFAWRFRQPLARYRFLYAPGRSDTLNGFLVLQSKARVPGWPVSIAACEPAGGSHALALLTAALGSGLLSRVRVWANSLADDARQLLEQYGFREIPVTSFAEPYQSLLVKPGTTERVGVPWELGGLNVLDLGNWDVRLLDSDVL